MQHIHRWALFCSVCAVLFMVSACDSRLFKKETPPAPPPPPPVPAEAIPEAPKEPPPIVKPVATKPTTPAAPVPAAPPAKTGDAELKTGLSQYANGEYKQAEKSLQRALNFGLASRVDRVNAFKHLAFMSCASKQTTACRYYFRQALNVNPGFQLTAAEAGHPLWGPVFREMQTVKK